MLINPTSLDAIILLKKYIPNKHKIGKYPFRLILHIKKKHTEIKTAKSKGFTAE